MKEFPLNCPVCQSPLSLHDRTFSCRNGHAYDLAAKGYVNLLTDKFRNSQAPGDNAAMVDARRRLLATGAYDCLGSRLESLAAIYEEEMEVTADVGCGEGTWTSALRRALPASTHMLIGMDISKEAIRRAAGKDRTIRWVVASLFHLPLADASTDALFNIFAPSADAEFSRVLRKGGLLFTAIPGRLHLWGLKEILYSNPRENDETFPDLPSFRLVDTVHVDSDLFLYNKDQMADLLSMTPYAWKSPKAGMERYAAMESLSTPVSFVIAVHRKKDVC